MSDEAKLYLELDIKLSTMASQYTGYESYVEVPLPLVPAEPHWYAIYTCANHEKRVADQLGKRGLEYFLPLYRSVRRWSDRRVQLDLALFPGYVFVRLAPWQRLQALQIQGVARLVVSYHAPIALPDDEIEVLRSALSQSIGVKPHPFLTVGRRVRITGGPFAGLTGVLKLSKNQFRVVVSVDLVQRSMIVNVERTEVAPLI